MEALVADLHILCWSLCFYTFSVHPDHH